MVPVVDVPLKPDDSGLGLGVRDFIEGQGANYGPRRSPTTFAWRRPIGVCLLRRAGAGDMDAQARGLVPCALWAGPRATKAGIVRFGK